MAAAPRLNEIVPTHSQSGHSTSVVYASLSGSHSSTSQQSCDVVAGRNSPKSSDQPPIEAPCSSHNLYQNGDVEFLKITHRESNNSRHTELEESAMATVVHTHGERPPSIINAFAAAVINYLLMFGLCCAYGMIMFQARHNKRHVALGVKMNLATAMIAGLMLARYSKVGVAIGGPDLNPVFFLGGFVETVAERIAEDHGLTYPDDSNDSESEWCEGAHLLMNEAACGDYHDELQATVIFTVASCSALLGFLFFSLGWFRLTRFVQYMPTSIMEAFLSCIGYKVFNYALKFCKYDVKQFVPAACIGVPLYFCKAFHVGNPAVVMPLGLLVPVGIFYGCAFLQDGDFDPIGNEKVMFPEIPNVEFWVIWTNSIGSPDKINFGAWAATLPDMVTMVIVVTLDCVLKISATEEKMPVHVDKDYEISLHGLCNFATTICGSTVGYMQLKFNVISYGVMGNVTDRRAGAIYAVLCGACYFYTIYHFNFLPRFFLSTLLFFAGSGFVAENLWGSRKYLSFIEWLEILVILFTFIFTGKLLYAVAVGVLLCGISFIKRYAGVPVLCCPPMNGRDVKTRERRTPLVQRSVDHVSEAWLVALRLKGFIFFGSAHTLTSYVRARMEQDIEDCVPSYRRLKYVCFDCEFLDGIDASGGKTLSKLNKECKMNGIHVIWSHLPPGVKRDLMRREIITIEDFGEKWFPDLNSAVLHVENAAVDYLQPLQLKWHSLHQRFVREHEIIRARVAFEPFRNVFLFEGPRVGCPWRYCCSMTMHKHETVLWGPGSRCEYLFLVHSGTVAIFEHPPDDSMPRKEWETPIAVYRHGWFLNTEAVTFTPSHGCAVAEADGEVLCWSPEQWRLMAREQPLMMHELMRSILKQREYDSALDASSADKVNMEMDNSDWSLFGDAVEQHPIMRRSLTRMSTPSRDSSGTSRRKTFETARRRTSKTTHTTGSQSSEVTHAAAVIQNFIHASSHSSAKQSSYSSAAASSVPSSTQPSPSPSAVSTMVSSPDASVSMHARFSRSSSSIDTASASRKLRRTLSDLSRACTFTAGPTMRAIASASCSMGTFSAPLQWRMSGLQSAQVLERQGFYQPAGENLDIVDLPTNMEDHLTIAFSTYAEEERGLLSREKLSQAIMYAGIFYECCPPKDKCKEWLDLKDFIDIARKLLFSRFGTNQLDKLRRVFKSYEDSSGRIDVSDLTAGIREITCGYSSAEEVESIADAWLSDASGTLTEDAFIAIMARYCRIHEPDLQMLHAFREVLGTEDLSDGSGRLTPQKLVAKTSQGCYPLTEAEAEEMLWAAGLKAGTDDDIIGLDFGCIFAAVVVFMEDIKGDLPPKPQSDKAHTWPDPKAPRSLTLYKHVPSVKPLPITSKQSEKAMQAMKTALEPEGPKHEPTIALTPEEVALKTHELQASGNLTARAKLYLLLEEPTSSRAATFVSQVMLILILLSVFVLVLEPFISDDDKDLRTATENTVWTAVEIVFTVIFTLELLVRASVANALGTQTLCGFLKNPGTICDIFAVIPYYTDLILSAAGGHLKMLRFIRVLRVGRVMRITRLSKMANMLGVHGARMLQPVAVVLVVTWGIYLKDGSKEK